MNIKSRRYSKIFHYYLTQSYSWWRINTSNSCEKINLPFSRQRIFASPPTDINPYANRRGNWPIHKTKTERNRTFVVRQFIYSWSAPVRHNPSICRRGVSRVMLLLAACNRVREKESDSSERTARRWLYANGRKKSNSIRRTFTVPSFNSSSRLCC